MKAAFGRAEMPKNRAKGDQAGQGSTTETAFQDRCLQPLGHPSMSGRSTEHENWREQACLSPLSIVDRIGGWYHQRQSTDKSIGSEADAHIDRQRNYSTPHE
jgi:hypothetical protein